MSAMVTANKVRKCGETSMHETINIVAGNARWDWATRGALLGIALLTLASCASSSSLKLSAQDHDSFMAINDNLIVPNQRIGPAFLGMTEQELYKKLGEPTQTMNNGPYTLYYYPSVDVSILKSSGTVIQVTASNPAYHTSEGIKVGSSLLEMKTKLVFRNPKVPDNVDAANADYHTGYGLNLGVTNGRVRAIWVVN
jgi:hypothetical protein